MIYEFPKSHIENIIVKGNEKTKDYVITRELPIESGDIFSKTKLEDGLRNLYNTQFFSAILPEFVSGSEQNLVDLVLTVEEGNTTSIEFGVTFTGIENPNESPISGFVKWADTNVGGTGKTISTSLLVSNTEQTVSLGYSDAWFLGMPLSISASLDFSHSNEICLQKVFLPSGINETSYYMDYEQYSFGANFSAGKRWNPNFGILTLTGGLGSNLIYNKYDSNLYTPVSSIIADNNKSIGINNSVWGSISVDDRDIYYDPSKGWFANQKFSFVGIIPEVESEAATKVLCHLSFLKHRLWNSNPSVHSGKFY
jgi:outer membrane protein insertion porin family